MSHIIARQLLIPSFSALMPCPPIETAICLPFVPYLIPNGEDADDISLPEWKTIVRGCNGLFRDTTAPHSKSNLDNLMEALKNDWRAAKMSKYIYPVLVVEETQEEDEDVEGELSTNEH